MRGHKALGLGGLKHLGAAVGLHPEHEPMVLDLVTAQDVIEALYMEDRHTLLPHQHTELPSRLPESGDFR